MTTEPPEPPLTLSDLAGELAKREDVLNVQIYNEPEHDWCNSWLKITIDRLLIPSELCTVFGNNDISIVDIHPPQLGQNYREIDIKEEDHNRDRRE